MGVGHHVNSTQKAAVTHIHKYRLPLFSLFLVYLYLSLSLSLFLVGVTAFI